MIYELLFKLFFVTVKKILFIISYITDKKIKKNSTAILVFTVYQEQQEDGN